MARRLALWLTLPTGFAGLVYEVSWEQSLATLLGSHSEAAAAVLALFLGGLATGYALFGYWARRLSQPVRILRLYGAVEIAIGLNALVFPELLVAARSLSEHLPALPGGPAFAIDVGLSALLLGPPAIAMGATIPLLTQAIPRDIEESTRVHARVYALNTLGAFAGALVAAFWLLPTLGLSGALRAMAGVNLLAGAAYLGIARALPEGAGAATSAAPPREPAIVAAAALLLGFAMMTLQTSMLRLASLSFGGSPFTFAMVVAVFVLCIALGSAAVSALRRVPAWLLIADVGALFLWLFALYGPLEDAPYFAHRLRASFSADSSSFYPFQAAVFGTLLAAIGPAALFAGASLPLLFDRLRRDRPDFGGVAGRLYAWNTLGSVAGALIGGYALFWWLDLHQVYRVAALAVAVATALLAIGSGRATAAGSLLLLPLLVALMLFTPWSPDRLSAGTFRVRQGTPATWNGADAFFASHLKRYALLFYDDDPTASVSVKQFRTDAGEDDRNIITNGKSDGSAISEYPTMALAALIPALFADQAERAFVIGLGTGVTSAELASLDGMREVLVAEISDAVIRAAPLFHELIGADANSERLRLIRGDAYRTLLRSQSGFDVIVSEPSNPWVAGTEMLFSQEFLEVGRRQLSPGGVYVQWLQLYETDARTLELALRTLAAVFEHVSVWYGMGTDLLLLGHQDRERALDVERFARRAARPDFAAGLARAGVPDLPALLAHELLPLGAVHALALEGPLHTLEHPRLRYAAARAFHVGSRAFPPSLARNGAAEIAAQNSLLLRHLRARGRALSDAERESFARETCRHLRRECLAWLAAWTHDDPDSPGLRRVRRVIGTQAMTRNRMSRMKLDAVAPLSRLFAEEAILSPGSEGVKEAEEATRLYAEFQHAAAPFSREGLFARWSRCEAEPERREACVRARRELEAELGPLGLYP